MTLNDFYQKFSNKKDANNFLVNTLKISRASISHWQKRDKGIIPFKKAIIISNMFNLDIKQDDYLKVSE